jgi:signal transduction histidine kinase
MRFTKRIRRVLLKLFYRKLWVKIAVILFVVVTIPVAVLGILLINTSQGAIRKSVLSDHEEIAARAAGEIGLFIQRAQDILNTTATMLGVLYPSSWKQETVLVELVLNQPVFTRVSFVNLKGEEIASSELGRGLNWDYPPQALEEGKKRRMYFSEVKFRNNFSPYVTMAVPVKRMGSIAGVLIADANLRGIWQIVDNIKIEETGRTFLVADDGTVIAHQDKKKVLSNENFKGDKDVSLVLRGERGAMELRNEAGEEWISSYSPVLDLGWGVVLRQEKDEAYLFSRVMKMQSWMIIILSELAVVLVSIFMGGILARPVMILASRIKRVADGDLEHRIEIERYDEIGKVIKSFNQMTKKLKEAKSRERLSVIGEMAAWIVHELKNSLVAIKGFVQLFPLRHKDEEFINRFSKLVPDEVNRWERMLRDLSDFSSYSYLNISRMSLKKLVENILEMMNDNFAEKNIKPNCIFLGDDFDLDGDHERLTQVFLNVIINAMGAMCEGGGELYISAKIVNLAPLDDPMVEIRVKDTGKGIEPQRLSEIFKPFHTNKKGGMGLGLAISRRIIKNHDGEISIESEVNIGTTVIIRLPKKNAVIPAVTI